jgi:bacillithiol system protein YtxJ
MSIFNSLFGSSEEKKEETRKVNWIELTNLIQLEEIVSGSYEKPVTIFKHSTRCSISRFALKQFENEFDSVDTTETYFLDLIENREVSNQIASRFGVVHQSPQLLLIKNGQSVYDASHSDIDAVALKERI